MFQPFPLFIALRYITTKRSNRFASFVTFVSIAGIALGVGALIIVLSVMNGFEREVVRHVLGMSSHAVLLSDSGLIADWPALERRVMADPRVVALSPYVRASGMLTRKGKVTGTIIEGIDPELESAVTDLASYLPPGLLQSLDANRGDVLLGDSLAKKLAAQAGDQVTLVVPQWDEQGRALAPRYERLRVAGSFHTGMHQYDARLVVTHIDHARRLFHLGSGISGVRTRLKDPAIAPQAASEIAKQLGADFRAVDWTQYERNFFLALKSQKHIMFVILVLIIAVAAFNIAANMIMIVTEKTRDIAILRTVGTTRTQIVGLFLAQGLMLGTVGALLGLGLGAWGAAESQTAMKFLEGLFGIDLLNSDVYFLDYLPADLRGADLVAVVGASLFLSLLATVYPALRAAAIAPARAVHFE
ncbi:MAG: lipoprotein-releasing ABC transporter permease subunit [Gammaproteobacteria bacterium]|nr:lipoprotein-releasing ABC transporter permease subunit [Gammaproteobacteria bacterium]